MEILIFEIVDLGAAPADTVAPGNTFRDLLDSDVMGTGKTAKAAFNDALDQLAMEGFGTRLPHESGIEAGYHGKLAEVAASELYEPEEGEVVSDDIDYHILIRFQDPTPDKE